MINGAEFIDVVAIIIGNIELVLFPLVTFALGWFVQTLRKKLKFRTFCRVFGKVAEDSDNLIISIPLWRVQDAPHSTVRFEKEGLEGGVEEDYGPNDTVSYDDLNATAQIASILAEFYPKPITYSLDNDRNLELEGKTIIMIGAPLANIRARGVFEIVETSLFDYIDQEETAEHPARTAIRDKKKNTLYDCSGDREYSMVLRIPNYRTPEGYFFIVSGPHASGTLAAATYLRTHWLEFKNAQPTAGIILGMPRGDIKHVEVVLKYGFSDNPNSKSTLIQN